jgi:hypothetical protein
VNGCSAGSSLVLLTVGDLNSPALTMRMAFVTLRAFHELGQLEQGRINTHGGRRVVLLRLPALRFQMLLEKKTQSSTEAMRTTRRYACELPRCSPPCASRDTCALCRAVRVFRALGLGHACPGEVGTPGCCMPSARNAVRVPLRETSSRNSNVQVRDPAL